MAGLQGCEVESGLGEEAVDEAGPVLHRFEPDLQRGQQPDACLVRSAHASNSFALII
jgi:hypothetical protein